MSQITNKMKETLPQIAILLGFWLFGELVSYFLISFIPGSIIGMVLLTISLEIKIIQLQQVENVADFLIRNMAFFFIPPGVGLMVNFKLIADNWVAILAATLFSTILVLITTAWVAQAGHKKQ